MLLCSCTEQIKEKSSIIDTAYFPCTDIRGYLNNKSSLIYVFSKPSQNSKILGNIPAPITRDDSIWSPGFDIIGSENGWLLINGAADDVELTGEAGRPMYSGQGWIKGYSVMVHVQASQGFASPDKSDKIIVRSKDKVPLDGRGSIVSILQCKDDWVKARWQFNELNMIKITGGGRVSGHPNMAEAWFSGICNIQETSCDGVSGDR